MCVGRLAPCMMYWYQQRPYNSVFPRCFKRKAIECWVSEMGIRDFFVVGIRSVE